MQVLEPRSVEQRDERRVRLTSARSIVEIRPTLDLRVDRLGLLADLTKRCERRVDFVRRVIFKGFARVDQRHVVKVLVLRGIRKNLALNGTKVLGDVLRHANVYEEGA